MTTLRIPTATEYAAVDVHCDTCGARPGEACTTPSGRPADRTHSDRRANASVINRHMRHLERADSDEAANR